MKNYILVLLAVLGVGVMVTPEVSKAEEVATSMDPETSILNEIEPIEAAAISEIATSGAISAPVVSRKVALAKTGANGGVSMADYEVIPAGSTEEDCDKLADNQVYRTGNLLFAHANRAFSNLKSLTDGATFSVYENGMVTNYKVSEVHYFKKVSADGLVLCTDGLENCGGPKQMARIKAAQYIDEDSVLRTHKIALMTCAGNNDSHRLVVFAD